jgi:hypothetical protein
VPQFEFRLGREIETRASCEAWFVGGTVYSDPAGGARLGGVLVRVWANGSEQGTTGTNGFGYWQWDFGAGTAAQGEVQLIHPDGQPRSPRVPFTLTPDCGAPGAVQQTILDFVGNRF